MRAAPAVSCAKLCKETHTSIQVQRRQSAIPCGGLRLMPRSPRRRIRLVTVVGGLKVCLGPVGPTHLRRLDTSNGCQDHTVLPYATTRLLPRASPGTGAARPAQEAIAHSHKAALQFLLARDAVASTAPRTPRIVTTRTPLFMRRDDGMKDTICREGKADYFSLAIWTTQITLNRLAKFARMRTRHSTALVDPPRARSRAPNAL